HYKDYPSDKIAFQLLNEPQYYEKEAQYNQFILQAVNAIRKIDNDKTIIISAPRGSSLEGLQRLDRIDDKNIIYDFHFYEPYIITNQGIHRGFEKKMIRYFNNVPYPSNLVDKDANFYARNAPNPAQAESELKEYVNAKWNRAKIAERLKIAKEWADKNKVKVICGEFGVLRNHIDEKSRYNWIGDVRLSLESYNIGWQIWDYSDLDGITKLEGLTTTDKIDGSVKFINPENGKRIIESEAIKALGLIAN
ncbi:MAG: cellulase family glycosylhydrolase, partial [Pseudomonadota bacterium]